MSCYSASSISNLIDVTPYLIAVSGVANDEAAIDFVKTFYEASADEGSVESAFFVAHALTEDKLNAVLVRSALEKDRAKQLIRVYRIHGIRDPIYVDTTEAEGSLNMLQIPRDEFLSTLTRKIRIHIWIFDHPRERALLSIGKYFGFFSWKNAKDVIVCHQVLKLKRKVPTDHCIVWSDLIVSYNDLYMNPYRLTDKPASNTRMIEGALSVFHARFNFYFKDGARAILEDIDPEQFKTTQGICWANLRMADEKVAKKISGQTDLAYLETVLSAIS